MHKCAICGGNSPKFALPLVKEEGKWTVKPICGRCRHTLVKEARAQKKFIPVYGLEASISEALRRNTELGKYMPFLEAFARQAKVKAGANAK